MNAILEDLTTLPPKRLEKRLEELARDALPCHSATVFDGNPDDGLTVALHVDSRRRRDVLDLARVVEDDAAVYASRRLVAARAEPSASVLAPASPVELRAARDVRFHGLLRHPRASERPASCGPPAPTCGGPFRLRLRRPP